MTGINQPSDFTQLDVPTDILCSYHYFSDIDMAKVQSWGTRIIGDSGAFSAMSGGVPIDREEFHAWAHRWRDALFWVAALDVIGDADASFENYLAAQRDGLDLVPTLHYGEEPQLIDRLVDAGASLIGLGGMVPYSSEKDRLMRWCLQMHRYARDNHPQVRFHGWGISHPYLMDNLPWWSADSSGFSSAFRFGTLRLWLPRRSRFVSVNLNGRDLARYAKPLRDHYNVDWKLISRSTPENRRPLGRVALRSVQLYAEWLQKRQSVSAPALLAPKLTQSGAGPKVHSATVRNESWNALNPQGTQSLDNAIAGKGAQGPLSVAATVMNQGIDSIGPDGRAGLARVQEPPLEREREGPMSVAAMGMARGAQGYAITPTGSPIPGPQQVAAVGGDYQLHQLDPERADV